MYYAGNGYFVRKVRASNFRNSSSQDYDQKLWLHRHNNITTTLTSLLILYLRRKAKGLRNTQFYEPFHYRMPPQPIGNEQ